MKDLSIGVIGSGMQGYAIGSSLAQAGFTLMFAARDLEALKRKVADLPRAKVATPLATAQFADVIILALPYSAFEALAPTLLPSLQGKLVLDATNTDPSNPEIIEQDQGNVARYSQQLLPGVKYVRAFSSVDFYQIVDSYQRGGINPLAIPIASDNSLALEQAKALISALHAEPVATSLEQAVKFQRGGVAFRVHTTGKKMRELLGVK
ncbi:NADPH-dependent F420 reductase [Psittacicella gerlachiana]|uniref:Pyrroline-5-carboxylate reductase catalytic N-terminal domain-containing protein n=1 Tax=Psittacicella gerlachiana TaxID=2028574 RepID=A0A3A1Y6K5_9GAMM|nr:NAD(P)-binding domain-containing protein [Psittacicella gerlachiana]RIY32909.1 hypothetical protein CKF59_06665 [Psittacicella gerlachiana]